MSVCREREIEDEDEECRGELGDGWWLWKLKLKPTEMETKVCLWKGVCFRSFEMEWSENKRGLYGMEIPATLFDTLFPNFQEVV